MKARRTSNSPAARLARAAGKSVERICREARCCPATFGHLARNGGANAYMAERLALAAKCDPQIFLYGLGHYTETGAAGSNPSMAPADGAIVSTRESEFKTTRRRRALPGGRLS